MKTILLPTDFSDDARNAASYAMALFGDEATMLCASTRIQPTSSLYGDHAVIFTRKDWRR